MAKTKLSRKSKVVLAFEKKKQRTYEKRIGSSVKTNVAAARKVKKLVLAVKKRDGSGRPGQPVTSTLPFDFRGIGFRPWTHISRRNSCL